MKIASHDRFCWIDIHAASDWHPHVAYVVEATVDLGHGRFQGINRGLHWLNDREFVAELDRFISDRGAVPVLTGTDDNLLRLRGSATRVTVEFVIGDVYGGEHTHRYAINGSFDINQDELLKMLEDFKVLFRAG